MLRGRTNRNMLREEERWGKRLMKTWDFGEVGFYLDLKTRERKQRGRGSYVSNVNEGAVLRREKVTVCIISSNWQSTSNYLWWQVP